MHRLILEIHLSGEPTERWKMVGESLAGILRTTLTPCFWFTDRGMMRYLISTDSPIDGRTVLEDKMYHFRTLCNILDYKVTYTITER